MNHKGQFTKIGKSKKRMYGPRALLVCGYPLKERAVLLDMSDKIGLAGTRIVFASSHNLGTSVGDILTHEDKAGLDDVSSMPRAVIMSGLAQNELHNLMAAYRKEGLSRQIWATLTPVSEKWPLEKLLNELEAEDRAMRIRKKAERKKNEQRQ
ncbi:MAG: DUF3783 domain-containing protein [Deltaproteobacteria bacterium]|nr:DUF3783 domain-containing protein [Deltaproteobacteria bacterium]